ncbi:uncharacterized protein BDW47DRAFT_93357 [Aspergillus candidus]|uniref:Uncharacterized protein n=1 Tax=Aspergillus candidus TaxID=41067 RepID=A0A2I2FHW3_ASPCN|nr:hypothetical protein BDW47DRAFT_93357 [Aspergillus candidus]PLB40227.1 hypothetical protein BDW47DRAFT_93357 [Aspergillus candidus]
MVDPLPGLVGGTTKARKSHSKAGDEVFLHLLQNGLSRFRSPTHLTQQRSFHTPPRGSSRLPQLTTLCLIAVGLTSTDEDVRSLMAS